jgi:hypothetical protein
MRPGSKSPTTRINNEKNLSLYNVITNKGKKIAQNGIGRAGVNRVQRKSQSRREDPKGQLNYSAINTTPRRISPLE